MEGKIIGKRFEPEIIARERQAFFVDVKNLDARDATRTALKRQAEGDSALAASEFENILAVESPVRLEPFRENTDNICKFVPILSVVAQF